MKFKKYKNKDKNKSLQIVEAIQFRADSKDNNKEVIEFFCKGYDLLEKGLIDNCGDGRISIREYKSPKNNSQNIYCIKFVNDNISTDGILEDDLVFENYDMILRLVIKIDREHCFWVMSKDLFNFCYSPLE